MTDFADTAGDRIRVEAESWLGTPHVLRAQIKGAGVDCVRLGAGILSGSGFPGSFEGLPLYRADTGSHAKTSALIEWFRARTDFRELHPVEMDPLKPGDMICIRIGKVSHHMAVSVGGSRFVHSVIPGGVTRGDLRDRTWSKRLVAVFRPMV